MKNPIVPKRPLSVDFTATTLERAVRAKRRTMRQLYIKELFTMKKNLLKQPAGALVAVALVLLSGAGVYAASNWFNGNAQVTSTDESVITVDLSGCKSSLPGGVDPNKPLDQVKFKIEGTPHISPAELERRLLASCEFANVVEVYKTAFDYQVGVIAATVKQVDHRAGSVTLAFTWGPWSHEMTVTLIDGARIFDKGTPATLEAFKPGDFVAFAYKTDPNTMRVDTDPFVGMTTISGLFKTQFDVLEAQDYKTIYDTGKLMPLDQYNSIHR